MKSYFALTLFAAASFGVLFTGCSGSSDHAEEVSVLDSLYYQVKDAETLFKAIDKEKTTQLFNSIKKDLDFVQANYEGSMNKTDAAKLADYRSVTKYVKDFDRKYSRLENEIERTLVQLNGLQKALESGATHDSQGNEITDEYVDKVFKQEKEVASSLIKEVDEMALKLRDAQNRYNEVYPEVKVILDSLRT